LRIRRFAIATLALLSGLSVFSVSQSSAFSPIPGRIFGLTDVSGTRGDLFRTDVMNQWVPLTSGLNYPESVSAAPNGRFAAICATVGSGGLYRIYRVTSAGSPLRNLIGSRQGCGQTVSPDSRRVAYISDPRRGVARLNVVGANGRGNRTLFKSCSGCMFSPVWAGKRIYFELKVPRAPSGQPEVFSVRAKDGKKLKRHTFGRRSSTQFGLLDVGSNGRNLLVTAKDLSGTTTLKSISPTGSTRDVITTGTGSQPFPDASYSPDGREIAYLRRDTDSDPANLWIGPSTGTGFSSLFAAPSTSSDGLYSIDWVRR
jgi:Tol biopolymer transport system component